MPPAGCRNARWRGLPACYALSGMDIQSPAPESAAQPVRILMPSPIGPLGVELRGIAVAGVRIDPAEPERASFAPLHQIDGSDFLDEVFGQLAEYFAGARRRLDLEL